MRTDTPILLLVQDYLRQLEITRESSVIYDRIIRYFIFWLVKTGRDVRNPSIADAIGYKSSLNDRRLSARTKDLYISVLKGFYEFLLESDEIQINIFSTIKRERKDNTFIKTHLTIEQIAALLASVSGMGVVQKRNYAIIRLMVYTGLRCMEVTGLDCQDIYRDPVDNELYLRIRGKGRSEKDREIPLLIGVYNPIEEYLSMREVVDGTFPLFISHARRSARSPLARLTPGYVSHMVKGCLRSIGLDSFRYSAHSLRHTSACQALIAGSQPWEVSKMLGHRSPVTSEIYLRSIRQDPKYNGAAIRKLDEYLAKSGIK